MPARNGSRRYGSIRVLRDGRVRFSPWTYRELAHVGFTVTDRCIDVERSGRVVLYLWLKRKRVTSACFSYLLSADELREAVSDLCRAKHGIERWIIPALQHNQASSTVRDDHPDTYEIIPGLLESVRELPVAETWQRTRRQLQREWAEQLRKHPGDVAKVPAPWLLQDG